ncbi:hypothetical protein [Vitiosangium sp. GDMCC 1.1324]|uniref:hypothetical protein n=1 Tax=Vitiosangium sp. (strain GDMCC 1.1324) TaxID=2138576 RepID=UPI0011B6B2FC|nr:hypothetical protein [Vitiosangium sp. GDMCC 1.1324]
MGRALPREMVVIMPVDRSAVQAIAGSQGSRRVEKEPDVSGSQHLIAHSRWRDTWRSHPLLAEEH